PARESPPLPDTTLFRSASWHLPQMHRDARAEYLSRHIPGARFYDIDRIAEPGTNLPHMAASPERFAEMVGQLGVSETDTIVVYEDRKSTRLNSSHVIIS